MLLTGVGVSLLVASHSQSRSPSAVTTSTAPRTVTPTSLSGGVTSLSGGVSSDGPYAVGTTALSLSEPASPGTGPRVLPTVVRYPALGSPTQAEQPGAAANRRNGPYPLVVFSQGYDVSAESYFTLLEHWAASGYVVVDPTYPFTDPQDPSGVDEGDIVNHPGDLRYVITSLLQASASSVGVLSGLIDPSEVAVVGHSDGGEVSLATAVSPCCRDPRVKAAVILSGAELASFGNDYYGSGGVPLLVVQGTADTINPPACSIQFYNAAPPPKYYVSLLGAGHAPPYLEAGSDQSVVEEVSTDFLDGYLKGSQAALAAIPADGSVPDVATISTTAVGPEDGNC
jgi:predicted dienelactone hydrolase